MNQQPSLVGDIALALTGGVIGATAVYIVYDADSQLTVLTGVFGTAASLLGVAVRRRHTLGLDELGRRQVVVGGAALLFALELVAALVAILGGNGTIAAILLGIAAVTLLSGLILTQVLQQ